MIRYYCDGCDEELTEERRGRVNDTGRLYADIPALRGRTLHVEVMTGMGEAGKGHTSNAGSWCRVCISTALRQAVSVPAETPKEG